MNSEQFAELMGKLTRIIELLEKEQQPKSYSAVSERGLPGHHVMIGINSPLSPADLIEAIGKPIPPQPPSGS